MKKYLVAYMILVAKVTIDTHAASPSLAGRVENMLIII